MGHGFEFQLRNIFYIFFEIYLLGGVAQLVERVVRNDEAPGSKPGTSILLLLLLYYYFKRR